MNEKELLQKIEEKQREIDVLCKTILQQDKCINQLNFMIKMKGAHEKGLLCQ